VTGAYGALGQQVARWLIERGVRHLLLLARKTPSPNPFKVAANENVAIYDRNCDLGNFDELQKILKSTLPEIPTLAGLFHCAGQLKDEPIVDSTSSGLRSVLNGKALGAQNLDALLESQPLEQFVMFSSAASVLGNGGQSSYAAANAFLDGIAHARNARELPALSINWGPFSGSGMATDESASRQLRMQGFQPLDPANLGAWLDAMLIEKSPQVMFVDCDWSQYCRVNPANVSLLSDITEPGNPNARNTPNSQNVDLQGQTPDERRRTLIDLVKGSVASLLGIADPHSISHDKPLSDLGLDSLLAVQLRNQLGSATSLTLPVGLAFSYPTLSEVASYLDICLSENEERDVPENSNNSETLQSAQATLDDLDELLKINP
jgi:acyl carrier protein